MRAKTILTVLFLASLSVAAVVLFRALAAGTPAPSSEEILAAAKPLAPGTLLRAEDVAWRPAAKPAQAGEIARPPAAVLERKPELAEQLRAQVYGAALRVSLPAGAPIRRNEIARPGDRDFLPVVLSLGERAIAIPVTTGGASTGLLSPGDRVDVILTQNFKGEHAPLTRRSVSETIVENLRVLAIDAAGTKPASSGNSFGRTVTLEVTPEQAEKINVATELGKLSITLRSVGRTRQASTMAGAGYGDGVKPEWAGDVSPALSSAVPAKSAAAVRPPPVVIYHGTRVETVKE